MRSGESAVERVRQSIGYRGEKTTWDYDAFGRVVKVYKPDPSCVGEPSREPALKFTYGLFPDVPLARTKVETLYTTPRGTNTYRETWTLLDGFRRTLASSTKGTSGISGNALAPPTSKVGDKDMPEHAQLGFVEEDPPAGTAFARIEGPSSLAPRFDDTRACRVAGRGNVRSSPFTISATRCSGSEKISAGMLPMNMPRAASTGYPETRSALSLSSTRRTLSASTRRGPGDVEQRR